MSEAPAAEKEDVSMTFWEHLAELRSRLLKALIAFVIGGVVAWVYRERLLAWVVMPLVEGWKVAGIPTPPTIHSSSPAEAFIAYLKLAVMGGLALSLPIVFYQVWAFIAPGLYSREKRYAIPFVVASTGLFVGGAMFGMRFAFPMGFAYLLEFTKDVEAINFQPTMMIDSYISFVLTMVLAFGAVFELPVLVSFLAVAGIVDHTHLIKFFRYFVVVAFFIAAIITPPDVMSQFLLAVPLILLYVVSIGFAWLISRSREPGRGKPDADSEDDDSTKVEKAADSSKASTAISKQDDAAKVPVAVGKQGAAGDKPQRPE